LTALASLQVSSLLSYAIAVIIPALDAILPAVGRLLILHRPPGRPGLRGQALGGLLVAFGVTIAVSGLIELIRRVRGRHTAAGQGASHRTG
jgi:hypothetical protein